MTLIKELEHFLVNSGFSVELLSPSQTRALAQDWCDIFGDAWETKCPMRVGDSALYEYLQQSAGVFQVMPLPTGKPPEVCRGSQIKQAIECCGDKPLPDLSAFASLELSISVQDYMWTMVHTHEDHAFGGPYFIQREWVG